MVRYRVLSYLCGEPAPVFYDIECREYFEVRVSYFELSALILFD